MKTVITKRYNYEELRAKGQHCSVLQECDFQGNKTQFVPMAVEGCHLEAVRADYSMYNTDKKWVKDLSAYETLELISNLNEPIRYHKRYYNNERYAWLEIINKGSEFFDSV